MKTILSYDISAHISRKLARLNRRRTQLWPWAALLLFLALPLGVLAHAQLVRSKPPSQATLPKAPAQFEVWFNELLENGFNSVEVFPATQVNDRKRTSYVEGKPSVDPKNPTRLSVKLKPLPPGEYMAEWRVLSRDGHSAPGRLTFRVLPPPASGVSSGTGTPTAKGSTD